MIIPQPGQRQRIHSDVTKTRMGNTYVFFFLPSDCARLERLHPTCAEPSDTERLSRRGRAARRRALFDGPLTRANGPRCTAERRRSIVRSRRGTRACRRSIQRSLVHLHHLVTRETPAPRPCAL